MKKKTYIKQIVLNKKPYYKYHINKMSEVNPYYEKWFRIEKPTIYEKTGEEVWECIETGTDFKKMKDKFHNLFATDKSIALDVWVGKMYHEDDHIGDNILSMYQLYPEFNKVIA